MPESEGPGGAGAALEVDEAVDGWLAEEFELSPVAASELGLDHFNGRLDDLSAGRFESEPRRTEEWTERFQTLRDVHRPADERVDVELVLCELAGRRALQGWEEWRREPAVYLNPCLGGVFALFLHRLLPEPELVAAATSRLRQVPAAVASGIANLEPGLTSPLLVERGLDMCRAGEAYFRHLLPAEVSDPGRRAELAEAAQEAAAALSGFASHLSQLATKAAGDWALGEQRYSALLTDRQLLGYGSAELHRRGEAAWAELDEEMTALAAAVDPGASGWREVMADLSKDHPADPDAMRHAYQTSTGAARAFLVERDLVTMPAGERCEVVPSPVFQRPVLAVASYRPAPPLSGSKTGHFFVPYPPEGISEEDLEQRLADNGRFAIPSVAVHEAYPGHHWHLTWAGATSRPVRHWVATPYFFEGWALYAEKMMREEGYFADPREQLYHLSMRAFRAVRMVVDTALHAGDMTVEEAADQLVTRAGLTEAVARAEVSRYCAWPTQAPSYLTGSLEIERIRRRWRAGPGAGLPLRQFHDAIASSRGLPPALAEMALFEAQPGPGGAAR